MPTRQFNKRWAQRVHPTISGFEFRFSSPEQRREPRSGGKPGRRFLDYFLWPYKESDWRAGPHPAKLFFAIKVFAAL